MSQQPLARPRVSAIVTCYNEQAHIAECLDSLTWCDEIIVVDSFSDDRTPEIVRGYDKVRFFQRAYYGGASQKNWAINRARFDWILVFDADEVCVPALREEIQSLLVAGPEARAYTIARHVHFLGRRIRFSGWQHDRVVRLVRRGCGYYENRRVHARLITQGPAPLLRNPMHHDMVHSLHEYVSRVARYGYWGAAQCWIDDKRSNLGMIAVRPLWRFLRTYLFQFGFLDGTRGLAFCLLQAYGTFTKWALLWSWQVNLARGIEPVLPEFDDDQEVWRGLRRIEAGETMVAVSGRPFSGPISPTVSDLATRRQAP